MTEKKQDTGFDYLLKVAYHTERRTLEGKPEEVVKIVDSWQRLVDWAGDILLNWRPRMSTAMCDLVGIAVYHLKGALFLLTHGFYKTSFLVLRTAMENALLAFYFDSNSEEYEVYKADPKVAPPFQKILNGLFSEQPCREFDSKYALSRDIIDLYSRLSSEIVGRNLGLEASYLTDSERISLTFGMGSGTWQKDEIVNSWFTSATLFFDVLNTLLILRYPQVVKEPDKVRSFRTDSIRNIVSGISEERKVQLGDVLGAF